MPEKMLQFTHLAQHQPDKRSTAERRTDFDEIYRDFAAHRSAGAKQPLQPVRRAVLFGALPAEQ